MKDKIIFLGMKDTVKNSKIALPVIMLFEIIMLITWLGTVKPSNSISYYGYPIGYALLLIVALGVYIAIWIWGKNIEIKYKKIAFLQSLFAAFFVLWALAFTYIGAIYRSSFSELLYVTIVTLIPVFCYLNPVVWTVFQGLSAGIMIYIAYLSELHFDGFRTNFLVFTLISIIAANSLYGVRKNSYLRQLMLEASSEENKKLAFYDAMTELPNRRSYEFKIQELREHEKSRKTYIGMFDLNGLKRANDTLGHEAGDALIIGAAQTLSAAFDGLGTVYRIGGDEFAGVLEMSRQELDEAVSRLGQISIQWTQNNNMKLSIAYGFSGGENSTLSLEEMETEADNAMYENKKKCHEEEKNEKER